MAQAKHATREQWLMAAVELLRPEFKTRTKSAVPAKTRVTCSWPLASSRKSAMSINGQCFPPASSTGGYTEIFISPTEDRPWKVLGTLTHELVHAAVGNKEKHNAKFYACAKLMLLEGKPKECGEGKEFIEHIGKAMMAKLGPYPHKEMRAVYTTKKQGTRMVKCSCAGCGYIARTTAKWIEKRGAPLCPCNQEEMEVE